MNRYYCIFVFLALFVCSAVADDFDREVNLKGKWRFEPGDDAAYAKPDYDDSHWELIKVPSAWEEQGFPGYDGFAWYRKSFNLSDDLEKERLILNLGYIDDVDELFINGKKLGGKGMFPPNTRTAHNELRLYELPKSYLNFDKRNVIAIRVYDYTSHGGIKDGDDIGIYSCKENFTFTEHDLAGSWKFSPGDDESWASPDFNDSDWKEITAPGVWETQGFPDYDGFAWYRKKIDFDKKDKDTKFILVLGMIDDFDEVYFNGVKIGHTGPVYREQYPETKHFNWKRVRYYFIPSHLIRWDKDNTLAVCVYDVLGDGGILYGPLAIVTRDQYKWMQRKHNRSKNFIEQIFE